MPSSDIVPTATTFTNNNRSSTTCSSSDNRNYSRQGFIENNIISSWSTAFNTVEEILPESIPIKLVVNKISHDTWKSSKLMLKLKNREFSASKQHILDTKYKYYNPFATIEDTMTFGGWDISQTREHTQENYPQIRTCNDTYKNLTKHWKSHFLASIDEELSSFRLLWTASMSWHYAGLKIYSLLDNSMHDIMHTIGECLIGRSVYVKMSDIKEKAQYEGEYIDRDKSVITNLHPLSLKFKTSSFLEYRFLCAFIQQYYQKRVKECVKKGFLMCANDFAQFCYAEKCDNITRVSYGSEMELFAYRQEAMLRTFEYIDDSVADYPLDSESEVEYNSDPYFSEEENIKIRGMHKNGLKEMLFMLQFSGFESTLKCPCSKLYHNDLMFLYGCPLPDNPCKNQIFHNIGALYQHFNSKSCIFHSVLSNYIVNLSKISGVGHIPNKKRKKRSRK